MAKLTEKQLLVITLTFTILPTCGIGYVVYGDYTEWKKVKATIADVQNDIDLKNRDIYKIPSIKRDLDNQAYSFDEDVKILPSQKEVENLTRDIQNIALKTDIGAIQDIKPVTLSRGRGKGPTADFNEFAYQMNFTSNFRKLAEFVNALETNKRFLQVENLGIKPPARRGAGSETSDLQVDLKLKTYSYTQEIEKEVNRVYVPTAPPTPPTKPVQVEEIPFVPRSNWRDPFQSQLVPKAKETSEPGEITIKQPGTGPAVTDTNLTQQQQHIEELNRKLKALRIALGNKNYAETIPKLDEFDQADRAGIPITNEKLMAELKGLRESYQDIKEAVLRDLTFIVEFSRLRRDEIQSSFLQADKSGEDKDYQSVVDEYQNLVSTLKKFFGEGLHPDVQAIVTSAGQYAERAETRLDFRKLNLKVLGVAYLFDPEEQEYSRAVVSYGSQSLELDAREVYSVDEAKDLKLHAVVEDGVIFEFKGELIMKPIEDPKSLEQTSAAPGRRPGPGPGRPTGGARR